MTVRTLVERGVLLELPIAALPEATSPAVATQPVRRRRIGDSDRTREPPLVVDLSSLWAGPLCARLLAEQGARIVKLESVTRPDGARAGPAPFFDLLHHGHESVAFDLTDAADIERLRCLLAAADVVIEASRPRALEQLGIDVPQLLAGGPTIWVSITGHGRSGSGRNRVAFGDDAAAGGGLVAVDVTGPCFVADAIADPLSGVAAAAAVTAALDAGGRWLLDVAMARVAAYVAGGEARQAWTAGDEGDAAPPPMPVPAGPGPALGEHTEAVLRELGVR